MSSQYRTTHSPQSNNEFQVGQRVRVIDRDDRQVFTVARVDTTHPRHRWYMLDEITDEDGNPAGFWYVVSELEPADGLPEALPAEGTPDADRALQAAQEANAEQERPLITGYQTDVEALRAENAALKAQTASAAAEIEQLKRQLNDEQVVTRLQKDELLLALMTLDDLRARVAALEAAAKGGA